MIDTHCHIQDRQYDVDRNEIIKRARENNVSMICVGTDFKMSQKAIALAELHNDIWASIGLHPNDNLGEVYDQSQYKSLAQHPKVIAIGEIGLDYYRTVDEEKKKFQRERFLQQLELAEQTQKPVIIHCRDPLRPPRLKAGQSASEASAHRDMQEILKSRAHQLLGGVIHSFTGTYDDAKKYIELGFCIGFNGIITFTRQYDETVQKIPLEKILVETDSPYLAPEPHRGKRNEPAYIVEVIKQIGVLRNISDEDVIAVTSKTTQMLFGLE